MPATMTGCSDRDSGDHPPAWSWQRRRAPVDGATVARLSCSAASEVHAQSDIPHLLLLDVGLQIGVTQIVV
jgi:hypothetical protein